jgi:hypothetical protein
MDGRGRCDADKRGTFAGRYGFIAMKFGDPVLDPFVEATIKPAIRDAIAYELVDLRNVSAHGDTAFTVPLFDGFMQRIMPAP